MSPGHSLILILLLLVSSLCHIGYAYGVRKTKRQIFREQVLPSSGGKIPESAFRSDRLSLNHLNKEGYSIPDGLLLDHRRHVRHPYPYQDLPEVLKVYQTEDGRFVSVFGKYPYPGTVDTTYIIRAPVDLQSNQIGLFNNVFPQARTQTINPRFKLKSHDSNHQAKTQTISPRFKSISLDSNHQFRTQPIKQGFKPVLVPVSFSNKAPSDELKTKAFYSTDTNQNKNSNVPTPKIPANESYSISYLRIYPKRKALRYFQQV